MSASLLETAEPADAFALDALHPHYAATAHAAYASHRNGRSIEGLSQRDIALARLYVFSFRRHTIGAFHAARVALAMLVEGGPSPARQRADEALIDLANIALLPVPRDFRAVLSTFHGYDQGIRRALVALAALAAQWPKSAAPSIAQQFAGSMLAIARESGVDVVADLTAPAHESFRVPNLGITIVPLAYGDCHSWNLAYLAGDHRDVPLHAHRHGVEIHLGYNPTHGETILGNAFAPLDEGYAMPIPPGVAHGWRNTSGQEHHVPFVFGSLATGGWGLFFDVLPVGAAEAGTRQVSRDAEQFVAMPYLERRINDATTWSNGVRQTLIPAAATNRGGNGGLELGVSRYDVDGADYPVDEHRLVSVVRGRGIIEIAGIERAIAAHDHVGVPAGMHARMRQTGPEALVALDCTLRAD